MRVDIRIQDSGSIVVLYPLTRRARRWFVANIDQDAPRWGKDGIACERRFVEAILQGASADGLAI